MISLNLLITIQIIMVTITFGQSIKDPSITKLKLNPPKGKFKIEATIKDQVNHLSYKTIEYLNGLDSMLSYGKLLITNNQTISLYHNQINDNQRLITTQFNYCYYMDRKLVSLIVDGGNLLNLILIIGPSIIFRLQDDSLNWTLNGDSTIATTITDDNKINLTTIYPQQSINQSDLIVPSQIILTGTISGPEFSSFDNPIGELIVIDLISLVKLDSQNYHDSEFKPQIGLGCPSVFDQFKLFPIIINSNQLSYQAIETVSRPNEDEKTSQIKIYLNSDVIVTINQNLINGIVDYNSSTCSMSTINVDDNFLDQVNQLIWFKGDFNYKGTIISQLKGELETWESTKYEETINGIKYDRVVTINQFQKINSPINSMDYIPITSTRIIHNEFNLGQFMLIESRTRNIMKFDTISMVNNKTLEQQLTNNCNRI